VLSRLCTYLRDADEALAVEQQFVVTIPLARDGHGDDEFIVRGAIDRVEISADGRVRLIDFKTARTPPSGPSVESDLQLGTYQLAVQHGALVDLVSEPEVGGAALVQLRVDASGDPGRPRIQEQPALGDGAWLADDIAAAIARVRAEDFPAIISSECRTCPYAVACPAQPAGREVLA
jgi:RecB family exonuclease